MLLMALLIASAKVISLPGFRLLGGAFYDELPRMVEPLYESIALCLAVGIWAAWDLSRTRVSVTVAASVVILAAFGYQASRGGWVHRHMAYWDRVYTTPRISQVQELGSWIMKNTEANAVLFFPRFDSEIWEAWTGRRQVVIYGGCYTTQCGPREDLVNGRLVAVTARLQVPFPNNRCMHEAIVLKAPVYVMVPSVISRPEPFAVCADARYLATKDWHAIVQYRKP